MTAKLFLRQFARSPRAVGAILPSSPALAHVMLAPVNFSAAPVIVEFGPGTGAFTREIARRLRPGSRYLGIELNEAFARGLAANFPHLEFAHGSVAELASILPQRGIAAIDAVICGLPWATLPVALQEKVFTSLDCFLRPGGVFATFGYFQSLVLPGAQALRQRLRRSFADVRRSPVVWANVPPAFAYICHKGG